MAKHRLTLAEAKARLPDIGGQRFVELLRHGSLSVELYAPRRHDPQQPHTRDEVYVVRPRRLGDFLRPRGWRA